MSACNFRASSSSSVGALPQQHALELPHPALLRQRQPLLGTLLFLQQLLNVAGGAQQDVACGLHGEDGPSQSLPTAQSTGRVRRRAGRNSTIAEIHSSDMHMQTYIYTIWIGLVQISRASTKTDLMQWVAQAFAPLKHLHVCPITMVNS